MTDTPPSRKKILLADDHHVITAALAARLADQYDTISTNTVRQMRQQLATHAFDLVVMDLIFRNDHSETSVSLLQELAQRRIPVVVYSGAWTGENLRTCMAAGVMAFIDKTDPVEVVREAIEAALSGRQFFPNSVLQNVDTYAEIPDEEKLPLPDDLSMRDKIILKYLCQFPNASNKEIGDSMNRSGKLVTNRLTFIFKAFAATKASAKQKASGEITPLTREELIAEAPRRRGFRDL